jgi:hypothetical protein
MGQKEVLDFLDLSPIWWSVPELRKHFGNTSTIYRSVRQLVRYGDVDRYIDLKTGRWWVRSRKWDYLEEKEPSQEITGELS